MAATPPPLHPRKNLRLAGALNAFLPGTGLFLLGRRGLGATLACLFLGSFLAVVTTFLTGYVSYLSIALDPKLLEGNKLEEAGAGFHQSWLISFAAVGVLVYAISTILFARAKRDINEAA